MPEGPEVRVVAESLNKRAKGRTITRVYYNASKFPEGFQRLEYPLTIVSITCKGKKIFFNLVDSNNNKLYFLSSLLMNGRWLWVSEEEVVVDEQGISINKVAVENSKSDKSHYHIVLELGTITKNSKNSTINGIQDFNTIDEYLCFHDSRPLQVGKFRVLTEEEMIAKKNSLGPDLLSEVVTWERWYLTYKQHPKSMLCTLIMNQKIFSGIGNYLKAEILYRARLKPQRKVSSLSDQELYNLYLLSIQTIKEAYSYGGLTIYNFWSPEGTKGTFPIAVYGKKIDPNGYSVITDKVGGRTNHWVPQIQL